MNNKRIKVIGIDFGTANTYVSEFSLEPEQGEKIRAIDFGYNQVGIISTSILYRKDKTTVIGKRAEDEWGESTTTEKQDYTFKTHFKPDIPHSEEAKIDTVNFLKILKKECKNRNVDIFDKNNLIIFGIPAEAETDYLKSFDKIVKTAGFKNFQMIYEPIGALIHHLHYGDISPSDAEKGIMVIDFGGGTCDFTFIKNLETNCIWGDITYGGRLFDDLFFQWYSEQNSQKSKSLKKNNSEYYVHWVLCRKAKEYFSDVMHTDRNDILSTALGNVRHYGSLNKLSWNSFINKASSFIPDRSFKDLKKTYEDELLVSTIPNSNSEEIKPLKTNLFGYNQPKNRQGINLVKWFEKTLIDGLKNNNIKQEDVSKIILTGGSSQWLFVKDIVNNTFKSDSQPNFILRSQNPKSAISEGLAILPFLRNKLETTSISLKKDLNKFVDTILIKDIKQKLQNSFDNLSALINNKFLMCFENSINSYKEKGGSVESFEKSIINEFTLLKKELNQSTIDDIVSINQGIKDFVYAEINKWFTSHGIKYFGRTFGENLKLNNIEGKEVFDVYSKIYSLVEYSIECMVAAFLGTVCGGKGLALIASGPIGWIVGAAIGLVISYLALRYGRKQTQEQLKRIPISPYILKLIFNKTVINFLINKQKKKFHKQTKNNYSDIINSFEDKVKIEIKENIGKVISQLTILNQIPSCE